MLLTKSLITFLNANRTPQLHTLLLITPNGKLLASASPHAASVLRIQATIACSLFAQYAPIMFSGTISSSLPDHSQTTLHSASKDVSNISASQSPDDLTSILIQLDHGTMIVRPLRCALLFVALGPSPSASISTSAHALGHELEYLALSAAAAPTPTTLQPAQQVHGYLNIGLEGEEGIANGVASSAASDNGSLRSGGAAGTRSLRALRRQAEELAKWLDGELEGFLLAPAL